MLYYLGSHCWLWEPEFKRNETQPDPIVTAQLLWTYKVTAALKM